MHMRFLNVPLSKLSKRKIEIGRLLVRGESNKEIAFALGISIKTVERHREQLYKKLNCHTIRDLTIYFIVADREQRIYLSNGMFLTTSYH